MDVSAGNAVSGVARAVHDHPGELAAEAASGHGFPGLGAAIVGAGTFAPRCAASSAHASSRGSRPRLAPDPGRTRPELDIARAPARLGSSTDVTDTEGNKPASSAMRTVSPRFCWSVISPQSAITAGRSAACVADSAVHRDVATAGEVGLAITNVRC